MASSVKNTSINLLGTTSRVEVPIIGVKIGNYTFGVYNSYNKKTEEDYYIINARFVDSLKVKKINGTVNQYTLVLKYPVTSVDDPNLLDKVFASVSDTRKISFSYGDASTPAFVYKEEEAIITKVKRRTDVSSSVKQYTISAVSSGVLNTIGSYNFQARKGVKPSDVIYEILYSPKYGLTSIFYGMSDRTKVEQLGLIDIRDAEIDLSAKYQMSVLDYLSYLVDMMKPLDASSGLTKSTMFILVFEDDLSSGLNGPYFKVVPSSKLKTKSTAYEIDVGFPSQNVVTDWSVEDDETYAIYYKFSKELNVQEYSKRIDDNGNLVDVFAPAYAPKTNALVTSENIKTWWTKVTEFPIKATITFKGLLRPAVLMSYVRVKIYFWGQLDIDSGLYIVSSQEDSIDSRGFRTTLNLIRVGGDDTYDN